MTIPFKVVVAGCGGMSNAWIDYALARPDTEIVGLVDIKLEFAEAMREKRGMSCGVFTDVAEAIRATGANLVFDITVPSSHYSVSTTAMKLGCNVLSEKPLAETMEQCNQIVRLADETGRSHAVMQNRRFDTRIRSLRQMLEAGTIGKAGYAGQISSWVRTSAASARRWPARCCWIWRFIPLTRPDSFSVPIRYPCIARNLTRQAPGMKGMRRPFASMKCRTDRYFATAAPGVRKVRRRHGKHPGELPERRGQPSGMDMVIPLQKSWQSRNRKAPSPRRWFVWRVRLWRWRIRFISGVWTKCLPLFGKAAGQRRTAGTTA